MTPMLDATVRFVLSVLFNGLWEAALIAAVAWVVLRAMPNGNATTRHSVLVAALLASVVLPVITAAVTTPWPARVTPSQIAGTQTVATLPLPKNARPLALDRTTRATAVPAQSAVAAPVIRRFNVTLPRWAAFAIVGVWLAGAGFVLLRLLLSLRHLEKLKSDALPVPVEYRATLRRWSAATKGARSVRLCRSHEIAVPIAVGLFDAMILVPERLIDELEPDDIDSIVLHELAHLRRGDDWINALERVAQALLFFNPGISWIVAQLDIEREVACDDWVLLQNKALPYATCLAKVVETVSWPYRAMSAPGAFVTRRGMSIRIERLLSSHRDVRVRTSLGPTGIAVAALGALCIVAAYVSPSIAYTMSDAATAVAESSPHPAATGHHKTAAPAKAQQAPQPTATPSPLEIRKTVAMIAATAPPAPPKPASHATAAFAPHPHEDVAIGPASEREIERTVQVAANSPDYIDDLAAAGYTHLSIDDLVRLKAVGVTGDYIRGLQQAGFTHLTVADLIRMRAVGVTPDYGHAMQSMFASPLTTEEITRLRALGVTADYTRAMRGDFGAAITAADIARMRAMGVSEEYVRAMNNAGYPGLTAEQVTRMRAVGVDAAYLQALASHGFTKIPIDQVIRMKEMGLP